jgi:hypothetical protein
MNTYQLMAADVSNRHFGPQDASTREGGGEAVEPERGSGTRLITMQQGLNSPSGTNHRVESYPVQAGPWLSATSIKTFIAARYSAIIAKLDTVMGLHWCGRTKLSYGYRLDLEKKYGRNTILHTH